MIRDYIYSFDENYFDISIVSIASLVKYNDIATLHILDNGIRENQLKVLKKFAHNHNINLQLYTVPDLDDFFGVSLKCSYWSKATYARLLIAELLPSKINEIIYIDGDTLITESLEGLSNLDFNNYFGAGVLDCLPYPKKAIGLSIDDKYYSNGFFVYNLNYIRRHNCIEKMKNKIIQLNGVVDHLDQGLVNLLFHQEILLIKLNYNIMPVNYLYEKESRKFFDYGEYYYSGSDINLAINHPSVSHFTGHKIIKRPWLKNSVHPLTMIWRNTYEELVNEYDIKNIFSYKNNFMIIFYYIVKFIVRIKIFRLLVLHIEKWRRSN